MRANVRTEVVAALGDQLEREVWADAVDLRQVLAEQRKERRTNIERGAVRLPANGVAVGRPYALLTIGGCALRRISVAGQQHDFRPKLGSGCPYLLAM